MFMSVTTDIMNLKYAMNVRFKQYVGLIKILLITQATKTILRHVVVFTTGCFRSKELTFSTIVPGLAFSYTFTS